jgi:hypothetical protein
MQVYGSTTNRVIWDMGRQFYFASSGQEDRPLAKIRKGAKKTVLTERVGFHRHDLLDRATSSMFQKWS